MRGVSRWASRVAPLLAVFVVLTAVNTWADEPPTLPTDPPQGRIEPPVGITAQGRIEPPVGIAPPPPDTTSQARVNPPVGVSTQARLQPPGGVTLAEMILIWLQSRISMPNG
jgi:hypothetical protein